MSRLHGQLRASGREVVTIAADGSGTKVVTFLEGFVAAPSVHVVPNGADEAAGATYSATSITKSSFTISVASSSLTSRDIEVLWEAVEKP